MISKGSKVRFIEMAKYENRYVPSKKYIIILSQSTLILQTQILNKNKKRFTK